MFGQDRVNSAGVVCYEPVGAFPDARADPPLVRLTEKHEKKRKERGETVKKRRREGAASPSMFAYIDGSG